jgi:phosphonatase-like hydrolase
MITASPSLRPIALVVLDMAGTTVSDVGLTEIAYASALRSQDVESGSQQFESMLAHIRATMGEPVRSVLQHLFDGDETMAQGGLKAFDARYAEFADAGQLVAMPGAAYAIETLRESGIKVALTTAFSAATQQCILDALHWQDIADLTVRSDETHPNAALAAAMAIGIDNGTLIATVGDTVFDVECGRQAGSRFVAGVLTGAHSAEALQDAGATHLLQGAMSLPEFITSTRR